MTTPEDRSRIVAKLSAVDTMLKEHAVEVAGWKRRALTAEAELDGEEVKRLRTLLEECRTYVASCVNDMPGNHARTLMPRILVALDRGVDR